ncbi:hypothetical protein [Brucella melitensis]|uniref:hypothetical protein n=1 Tax=Brucella melitensis TaxID=29459 RepID=UPI0032C1C2EC
MTQQLNPATGFSLVFNYNYSSDAEILRGSNVPPVGAICSHVMDGEVNGIPTNIVRWACVTPEKDAVLNLIFEAPKTMFHSPGNPEDYAGANLASYNASLCDNIGTGPWYKGHVEIAALSEVEVTGDGRADAMTLSVEPVTADTLLRDAMHAIEDNRDRYGAEDRKQGIEIQYDSIADAVNCMRQFAGRVHCALSAQDIIMIMCVKSLAESQTDDSLKSIRRLIGYAAIKGEAEANKE